MPHEVNPDVRSAKVPAPQPRRSRMWMPALTVAVCLVGVVGFGAVNYGGVTVPGTSAVRGH